MDNRLHKTAHLTYGNAYILLRYCWRKSFAKQAISFFPPPHTAALRATKDHMWSGLSHLKRYNRGKILNISILHVEESMHLQYKAAVFSLARFQLAFFGTINSATAIRQLSLWGQAEQGVMERVEGRRRWVGEWYLCLYVCEFARLLRRPR